MEQNFNKKCKNHQDKDYEFYCFNDKSFLCSFCFFTEHRNHNVDIIDNIKNIIMCIILLINLKST